MTSEFTIAVHALVFLHHNGGTCSSESLAQSISTNPARIRKIMAKLKNARIVDTKEGNEGGYQYVDNPCELSLYKVALALGFEFVSCGWKSGSKADECPIASGMADIMDNIYSGLNRVCLEELKGVTICELDRDISNNSKIQNNDY